MSRLTKIPVLGRLIRIASAFFRAPERFDALFAEAELHGRQLEGKLARDHMLQQRIDELGDAVNRLSGALESEKGRVRVHSRLLERQADQLRQVGHRLDSAEGRMLHTDHRLDSAEGRMLHTDHRLDSAEGRMLHTDHRLDSAEGRLAQHDTQFLEIFNGEPSFMNVVLNRFYTDGEVLENLNRELSAHPTVWGDKAKLHIAKSAAVFTCLFNTNSGSITVGEYTFAGSRVSILAGSHDPHLQGFLRRDAEIAEGCDIVIGDGVWLASNSTLLGPCTVGDNAIIAAGAVVTPGTHVPANTIYGGVPARKIAELDFTAPQDADNPYVRRAFERGDGMLFVEGWSEKSVYPGIPGVGHWLTGDKGTVLTDWRLWTLNYALSDAEEATLVLLGCDGWENRVPLISGVGAVALELPVADDCLERFEFQLENGCGKLFVQTAVRNDKE